MDLVLVLEVLGVYTVGIALVAYILWSRRVIQ